MKKFLTVLLALSVVFTYSFSAVGTAFAATYSASDAEAAMDTEITNQISYLNNAKAQVLNDLPAADNDGLIAFNGGSYFETAIAAGADKAIDDLKTAMVQVKNSKLDELTVTTVIDDLAPYKTAIANVTSDKINKTGFTAEMEKTSAKNAMDDAQAPLYKDYITQKTSAVKVENYSTKIVAGQTLNNQERVDKALSEYKTAMVEAEKATTSAAKITAYKNAYDTFKSVIDEIPSIEDEKVTDIDDNIATEANMAALRTYLTGSFYSKYKVTNYPSVGETAALSSIFNYDTIAELFYEKDAKGKVISVFGVEVKDSNKVTRSEAIAINEAFYKLITDSLDIFEVYAGKDTAKVQAIINAPAKYLVMASEVLDKVADVEKAGAALKAEYVLGTKVYDDAKVDEAIKEAKTLVYADLAVQDAKDYIIAAANKIYKNTAGLENLKVANFELQKLDKAIADAKAKFTTSVKYGANKTPEADLVYCSDTYAYVDEWSDIADEAKDALDLAQSYEEIDSIMADAKESLSGLMLAKDKADVEAAIKTYKAALKEVQEEQMKLVDMTKYDDYGQFWKALANGYELIDDAITVDDVKSAYAEAQSLLKSVKSDAELDEQLKAVQTLIDALPYEVNVKLEDKAQVEAARAALDAYNDVVNAASEGKVAKTRLTKAEAAIEALERAALVDELEAVVKKINALPNGDLGATEAIALKAEAQDLKDRIDAFNENAANTIAGKDYTTLSDFVKLNNGDVYNAELYNAIVLYNKAIAKDATAEDVLNAVNYIESLTDRQQYVLETELIKLADLKAMVAHSVEALKITASSTAKKGSITVKWTVKGDAAAADGYQIYRSVKKNSGFGTKPIFTTAKQTYKNTKSLKKGTRYYYKVRAYKVVDGKTYYSDWSNKAYRIAK